MLLAGVTSVPTPLATDLTLGLPWRIAGLGLTKPHQMTERFHESRYVPDGVGHFQERAIPSA